MQAIGKLCGYRRSALSTPSRRSASTLACTSSRLALTRYQVVAEAAQDACISARLVATASAVAWRKSSSDLFRCEPIFGGTNLRCNGAYDAGKRRARGIGVVRGVG